MDYDKHLSEDRRLVILRVLLRASGYSSNESILHDALRMLGHRCSRDVVRTELTWLAEQGLVRVEVIGTVHVAKLTSRGQDCAGGDVSVPGVKRPRAED